MRAVRVALFIGGVALWPLRGETQVRSSTPFGTLATEPDAAGRAWVDRTLAGLSLERRVAQLICPDIAGGYLADSDPRLAQWTRLAHDYGVGMFVLYGGTPRDVAHLLNQLQRSAAVPLLMSADFEGGPGQQVTGASEYPPNMAFAATRSADLVHRAALAGAREGRAMGIHLTYTPVSDIAWRPENPAEGGRSFGGDLGLMADLLKAYVSGYHAGGMLTTAKHFPGRGDVEAMPNNPPWQWNPKSAEAMKAQEFTAFRNAINAGVDFVMTEHIAVPSVTGGSELPASVEKKLATDWLRDSLGFKGVLTSDDLWYDHVIARFGAEEVAVRAFEAGHDIILKPKDPVKAIAAMAAAVRSGRIPEQRVNDAVRRLLTLKARLGLHRQRLVDEGAVGSSVATPEHLAIVQEAADRSLTLLRNEGVLPVAPDRLARLVNISIVKVDDDPAPAQLAGWLATAFPGMRNLVLRTDAGPAAYELAWKAAEGASLVVFSLFVQRNRLGDATPLRAGDVEFMQRVSTAHPHGVVAMSFGNPHLIRRVPWIPAFLTGYGEKGWFGNQQAYFESLVKVLKGEVAPSGRLPIRVSDAYPIGGGK